MWKLVIEDDEGRRTVVPLTRELYSIGRKEGNTIRLTERNVSREHARIFKRHPNGAGEDAGALEQDRAEPIPLGRPIFVVEDLTSYNGVFVNGLRVAEAQDLSHGDLVQIGDYRIVLQDEMQNDVAGTTPNETKQTLPQGPHARATAAALLDRPNRLVMLAGPTPGAEFPLDRERLTVGRAEDADISVNHNSVSRLHCEVHALGDGRFEIVDKGSSNGVRVNSAELRRGIIEPGDVIELGDVKFKFIGAGQIFRPTESQQLALLSDRQADVGGRRRFTSALPVAIFLGIVSAGAVAAWVWARPRVPPPVASSISPSQEEAMLDEAKRLCAIGDCETAHDKLSAVPDSSPTRLTQTFADLENRWADLVLAQADPETDPTKKRAFYQRVAQAATVDAARRKVAAEKLQQLEAPLPPSSEVAASASESAPAPAPVAATHAETVVATRPDAGRRTASAQDMGAAPAGGATALAAVSKVSSPSVDERERQLALQGTQDAKMLLKQQLEQRVNTGRASETELRLLVSTCKDLGDKMCVQQTRAMLQQRLERTAQ
jgi:pSer/pThr/pTyr-binding forkhead associated (FHA) protein